MDDLHNQFPQFLQGQERFRSVSDVFAQVRTQMNEHFNPQNREMNRFHQNRPTNPSQELPRQTTVRTEVHQTLSPNIDVVTETQDLTSLFPGTTSPLNLFSGLGGLRTPTAISPLSNLLQILQNNIGHAADPVIVAPTREQIDAATSLRQAATGDEERTCAICQENQTSGQAIRRVNHCTHEFHKNCVDLWFERNVRCPVCRHDIRENDLSQVD